MFVFLCIKIGIIWYGKLKKYGELRREGEKAWEK